MMVTHFYRGVTAALVVVLVSACSSSAGASDEEITQWMESREGDPSTDLGVMQARVGPSDEEVMSEAAVEMDFSEPAQIEAVSIECLGKGTLDITIFITTTTESAAQTMSSELACGDEAHQIALDATSVRSIGIGVSNADRDGAWAARVLGTIPG
jgi:hypothetical protein